MIIVLIILLRFRIDRNKAFFLVLFYAVLPLNTSTVAWLGARADLLAAFFILSSLLLFLKFKEKGKALYIIFSLLMYSLALLSKEMAFVFFLFILLLDFLLPGKPKYSIFYAALAFIYLIFRIHILGRIGTRQEFFWGQPYVTILSSLVGLAQYFLKFFWPFNLSISDAFPKYHSLFNPIVFSATIFDISVFLAFIYSVFKRKYLWGLGLGWILIFYLPISNIVPALHFWAERFFYIPGFGLVLFLGYLVSKYKRLIILLSVSLVFYASINFRYQNYFKDDISLCRRAIEVEPFSQEPYTALGYYYLSKGDYLKSIYYYLISIQPNRNYYSYSSWEEAYNNLGVIFLRLRKYQVAERWFRKALEYDRNNKTAALNLRILQRLKNKN